MSAREVGTAFAFGSFAFWVRPHARMSRATLSQPLPQVAIGAVAAVEKFGGELGGLIATWPSNVIPSMMAIR